MVEEKAYDMLESCKRGTKHKGTQKPLVQRRLVKVLGHKGETSFQAGQNNISQAPYPARNKTKNGQIGRPSKIEKQGDPKADNSTSVSGLG
jgi:hypothetical protein